MIRREESEATWVIHQAAHAYISGQIAEHWAMDCQPADELVLAAYCHDAGWAQADLQPRINPMGQPRTFIEMDLDEHFVIWQSSIDAVAMQNRYAGLLTSLHCAALYEQRLRFIDDPPADRARIEAFLDGRYLWQEQVITALGSHPRYGPAVEPDWLAANLRLLQVWDYLSLLLCMSTVHEQTVDDVPLDYERRVNLQVAGNGTRAMLLNPFPLDQPLTLWIEARPVVGGPFDDDAQLQRALAGVPYKPVVFEIGV